MAAEPTADEIATREAAFSEMLSNSALVGHFSVDGQPTADPKVERYEIESVTKFKGDLWTITARVKYGKTDLKIPMTLRVVWADDAPMISMTNVSLPLGTFTARVFFYESRYAGTWQHGDVGGHMWGSIEKQNPRAKNDFR
ncbi:MAG: hypothetical protein R3C11_25620 [Planctomycetaceae bacterium]